ncbi:hypothetical protein KRX57_05785 [Weeksellaceae bacterium TAE3-ERU29]|nr:hypothetical protein [Weeksellaceae bacterium TAE3-ERU29]
MKKLILPLLATFALVSCGKQDKHEEVAPEVQVEEVETVTTDVPDFDNEEVEEYMKLYDAYIEEYKEAVKSKDMNKFQELSTKGQELATKGQELSTSGLSESDMQKLQEYMTQSAQELQELSQEMMK